MSDPAHKDNAANRSDVRERDPNRSLHTSQEARTSDNHYNMNVSVFPPTNRSVPPPGHNKYNQLLYFSACTFTDGEISDGPTTLAGYVPDRPEKFTLARLLISPHAAVCHPSSVGPTSADRPKWSMADGGTTAVMFGDRAGAKCPILVKGASKSSGTEFLASVIGRISDVGFSATGYTRRPPLKLVNAGKVSFYDKDPNDALPLQLGDLKQCLVDIYSDSPMTADEIDNSFIFEDTA